MTRTLPNFLVAAPAKAATNTIHAWLDQHPGTCMASGTKGTRYFSQLHDKGADWYANFFAHCPADRRKGEVDETYFFEPEAPARVAALMPECRIVTCLRDPVERAFSVYLEFLKFGMARGTFEEVLETNRKNLVEDSFYDEHLQRWFDHFPREQVLVLLFDDLRADTPAFARELFGFLGLDPTFQPGALDQRHNAARPPRFPLLNRAAFFTVKGMRRLGLFPVIERAKRSTLAQKILFRDGFRERPEMHPDTEQGLRGIFRPHNERLAVLLDRNLDGWR